MLPILLAGIAAVSAIALLASDEEEKFSDMANAHNQFLSFEQAVSITSGRRDRLIASRQALQKRILEYFKKKSNMPVPKFFIQGSYKMGTMVRSKDGEYDVDLGVYFLTKPNVTAVTIKNYVFDAVLLHTEYGTENRDKCVRVRYAGEFDIDLPVYYMDVKDKHPYLATKSGWQLSDPKELCDWFERQRKTKDKSGQLLR